MKAINHEGTIAQRVTQRTPNPTCNWGQSSDGYLYVSRNKHANYLNPGACGLFNLPPSLDHCDNRGIRPAFQIYNVGEITDMETRFIDALDDYGFRGEFVWRDVPFKGGLRNDGKDAPGSIVDKLRNDSLLP